MDLQAGLELVDLQAGLELVELEDVDHEEQQHDEVDEQDSVHDLTTRRVSGGKIGCFFQLC